MRSPALVVVALIAAAVVVFALAQSGAGLPAGSRPDGWSPGAWLPGAGVAALGVLVAVHLLALRRAERERRHALQTSELHLAAVEALALAIDAKDHTAEQHVRRVTAFATALAARLRLPEALQAGIRTAALLHDVGKLGVPEHILTKPGPLSAEEWRKVRSHPQVGADIIAAIPFPFPVAPLVLSHHERWDGMGYPAGLQGEQIPLGARILAVADCYESVTSARAYRPAMTSGDASAVLRNEAGKSLDPALVEAFLALLPGIEQATPPVGQRPSAAASLEDGAGHGRPSVLDDIALAHREMHALYEIAQTMGTSLGVEDTMKVIVSKLAPLVPFSTCALYLSGSARDSLQCQFATGVDAELFAGLSTRLGHGQAGWVTRSRRNLVNARPAGELEAAGLDPRTRLESALVCPLIFGQHAIGALAVYHTEPGIYRDDHQRLLERVSEQAAAVIHNAVVFERTQQDSLTDPLTGLPNIRFMLTHLQREVARADRLRTELAILVLDVDGFKEINDTHGHRIGDRALREVARGLRAAIRPYDVCVRYAGDEFVVVLSGCGRDDVEDKRRELQEIADAMVVDAGGGLLLPIGVSVGAAVFPHDGDTTEVLLARADHRMYIDKNLRRQSRLDRHSIA